jgi:hypothetical protein
MSWVSIIARAGSMALVLPLALRRLDSGSIALWLFISTVSGLLLVADMGFASTFARIIAFAMGGADHLRDLREVEQPPVSAEPNWRNVARISGTMRLVYLALGIGWLLLLATAGTWFAAPLIRDLPSPRIGQIAWATFVTLSALRFFGFRFSSVLQGYDRIAQLRGVESLFLLAATAGNIAALLLGGGLPGLVLVTHGALLINAFANRLLTRRVEREAGVDISRAAYDSSLLREIWPTVWRSGLGLAMSAGVVQLTGVVYTRLAPADEVASYLLALTLVRYLTQFAQAPFYSQLPQLARLRAQGRIEALERVAARSMRRAYWALVLGCVSVGLLAAPGLEIIGSNLSFVPDRLWAAMSIATFASRFGAMHLHLYSTTNHIVWHIANGVTGTIYIACAVFLTPRIGVMAFPTSELLSDLLFYTWYCAARSYSVATFTFRSFEARTSLLPLLVLLGYGATTLVS